MKTINIFGCCVSRDIFDEKCIQDADVYEPLYDVLQYVALTSPMSIYQPAPKQLMSPEDIADFVGPPFRRRCMVLDHNNACFDYIKEKTSDYLVMDIADARLSIAQYQSNHYVSCAMLYAQNRQRFEKRFGKPVIHRFNDWSDKQWEQCANWYCDRILEMYNASHIIFLDVRRVDDYIDKSGFLRGFTPNQIRQNHAMNTLLRKFFSICIKRFQGCHIIRMPEHTLADASHKLGLLPLHYHKLYYQYAFRALRVITEGDTETEDETLWKLYDEYCARFSLLRSRLIENRLAEREKLVKYAHYFPALINHYDDSLTYAQSFCKEKGIRRVAFYGDLKPTEVLMQFLRKCGVTFDYIVSSRNHYKSLPLVSPKAEQFPETDALIICDIMKIDALQTSLKDKGAFSVYTIYDFLPPSGTPERNTLMNPRNSTPPPLTFITILSPRNLLRGKLARFTA